MRVPVSSSKRPFSSQTPDLLRRKTVLGWGWPVRSCRVRRRQDRGGPRSAHPTPRPACARHPRRTTAGALGLVAMLGRNLGDSPTIVSIIGLLNRPSKAAVPVAGATAGIGVPSRLRPDVRARARFTTVSAADLGTSARCSKSRATERYPNNSMTPRDSISTSREPISASADRTTVSSAEIRSAKATASAFHTVSLSTHQDYRQSNAWSSHEQVEATVRQGKDRKRRFPTPRRSRISKR